MNKLRCRKFLILCKKMYVYRPIDIQKTSDDVCSEFQWVLVICIASQLSHLNPDIYHLAAVKRQRQTRQR